MLSTELSRDAFLNAEGKLEPFHVEERVNVGEEHETRKPQSKGPEAALCLDRPGSGKAARNRKDDVG